MMGFDKREAQLYFDETITPHVEKVHDTLRQNVYLLSDKSPIKIALALDWLDRGIPLMPEITTMQPAELENMPANEMSELRTRFEYALMDGIRQLESPVDEVILYMAHFHKRFNRQILEFFFLQDLGRSARKKQAAKLIAELRELPFVKFINDDYFVLHDEMARLVQQHVWDLAEDSDKTLRRELSAKACDYYKQELATFPDLSNCTEQQQVTVWSYRVEQMYYRLYADFGSGYEEFEHLFEQLVDDHRHGLATLAINFLREFEKTPDFSDLLTCFVAGYYDGGVSIAQQKFIEAEAKLTQGEQRIKELIIQLDLAKARPLDRHLSERLYLVYHQLGFCYRSIGNWQQAIRYYNQSLEIALGLVHELSHKPSVQTHAQKKSLLLSQIAETLNSLANVHRFTGDFYEARLLCQTSILLRQTWDPDQVATSKYVMAMILWQMGSTAEAMSYLQEAERVCPPQNEILQALITKHRAYIYFHSGMPEKAAQLLKEVEAVFRKRGHFSELADTLNLISRICGDYPEVVANLLSEQDYMGQVEKFLHEAEHLAYYSGDEFRQAECHLTQALHYLHWSRVDQARCHSHHQSAICHWEKGVKLAQERYYQLWSLFCQVRGDIAFESAEPNYDVAFAEYGRQCRLATRFKRAVYERAVDRLTMRLGKLRRDRPDLAERYISNITYEWHKQPELRVGYPKNVPFEWQQLKYPELVNELNLIRETIEEERKMDRFRLDYERAMRRGEWRDAVESGENIITLLSNHHDRSRAEVILDQFRAVYRLGDLTKARHLAKTVLHVGQELQDPKLIGDAYMALSTVFWDTTNTAEAADYLNKAKTIFTQIKNEPGLIKVRQLRSHILYRIGFFDRPLKELTEIAQFFEQQNLASELADVWNLISRIFRTYSEKPDLHHAYQYAKQALQKAESAGDAYRLAECHLSLALLALQQKEYDQALEIHRNVFISSDTHLLRGLFEGVRGTALFELGMVASHEPTQIQRWDEAFEAFVLELVEITKSKLSSLPRALDMIYETFMRLPNEMVKRYAGQVEEAWRRHQLDQEFPMVGRMCEEVIRYRPYIQSQTK
ncbi:MAG: tetratricopeptide repeat protein [Anaerolineae bacterium]|nr:tetratricopeptide repeat protein [Anaerolineae bacterium]